MSQGQGSKPSRDMRLKITGCRHVYTGRNQRGDQYSIYEIDAERAQDGMKINQKLRAFSALPIGQVIDVTVTPFVSERHGKSFTLEPKQRTGGGGTQRVNDLAEEMQEVNRRVAEIARRIGSVEELLRQKGIATPPQQEAPAQADPQGLSEQFGDNSPW